MRTMATAFSSALKSDAAPFANACLLNRVHLAFQSAQLRSICAVAADKKRCWPENNDSYSRGHLIIGRLSILLAGCDCGTRTNPSGFLCKLLVAPALIQNW